jgi:triosephosphate isomerase (TIM)
MTNKLRYFIGNWKMFGDFSDFKIIKAINSFSHKSKKSDQKKKIVLCVPSTLIYNFNKKLVLKSISLGVQNCHYYQDYGPFTGSLNAKMLKGAGAEYIILGHSENRLEGETDKLIKKKIISSLKRNLNIILCIGETLSEKKKRKTFSVLKKQLRNSLMRNFKINKIIIAYEPVWSIGTNKIPKVNELEKTIYFIKKEVKKIFNISKSPVVLYGGSVNEKNIRLFSLITDMDGFLIGGASQSSKKFIDIVKNYYK